MWRPHLFCLGSRPDAHWQEVLGLVTKTRVASAVARELANRIFGIFTIGYTAVACFFPPLTAAAVGHAASCGTQRASPVNAHISTCQLMELTCRLPTCRVQVSNASTRPEIMLSMLTTCAALHRSALLQRSGGNGRASSVACSIADGFCRGDDLFQTGSKADARAIVNVLGRWQKTDEWDTIGIAKELDEILAGERTYEVVEISPIDGGDRDYVQKSPRRRDFCKRKGVVQRYILGETVGLLPFNNAAMAASVGATCDELNAEPIDPFAVDVVFDALSESKSGIEIKADVEARRASFQKMNGKFDEEAFAASLSEARAKIIKSLCFFPGSVIVLGFSARTRASNP